MNDQISTTVAGNPTHAYTRIHPSTGVLVLLVALAGLTLSSGTAHATEHAAHCVAFCDPEPYCDRWQDPFPATLPAGQYPFQSENSAPQYPFGTRH
jgi:hypothetical protein